MKLTNILYFVLFFIFLVVLMFSTYVFFFKQVEYVESIQVTDEFKEDISQMYELTNNKHEFVLCLKGEIKGGIAYIDDYEEATLLGDLGDEGVYVKCPRNIIGTIHNHQIDVCRLSSQDIYSFGVSQHSLIGVICGSEKIVFYTPNNLNQGILLN